MKHSHVHQTRNPIPSIPPGVQLLPVDGGTNYYSSNSFTNAAAAGWDTTVFPIGTWSDFFTVGADITNNILAFNSNTVFTTQANQDITLFSGKGVSLIGFAPEAWAGFGGGSGWVTTSGGTGVVAAAPYLVGLETWDEPGTFAQGVDAAIDSFPGCTFQAYFVDGGFGSGVMTVTTAPIGQSILTSSTATLSGTGITAGTKVNAFGSGTGGLGTYAVIPGFNAGSSGSPVSVTQAAQTVMPDSIQDNKFWWLNMTGNWVVSPNLGGMPAATVLTTLVATPTGTGQWAKRHVNIQSLDYYWYERCSIVGSPALVEGATIMQTGGSPLTRAQCECGARYGDVIDLERPFYVGGFPAPIYTFVDLGNALQGAYFPAQAVLNDWAVWSTIIHGCRGISYFQKEDGNSPSGGGNVFTNTYYNSLQAASFTGSISAGVLTVTSAVTGAPGNPYIGPGMVATSGVTGASQILQQLTTTDGSGRFGLQGTYQVSGGALSASPATYTQPVKVWDQLTATAGLIKNMAPVINSPFATGYAVNTSPGTGYTYPTGTLDMTPGIDFMVKYYTGTPYSTIGSYLNNIDTITPGFYIFANTRYPATTNNINVTFTIPTGSGSSVTVINENRTRPISAGVFTDTFANAWTTHIYKVNP